MGRPDTHEAPVARLNPYEVSAHELYDALESVYRWVGDPYPSPMVPEQLAPYRQDAGPWMEGETNANRFTNGRLALVSHPRCTVTAMVEQSDQDPSSYTLYVARTVIDLESYGYSYQDISLRSYEVSAESNLTESLTMAEVLAVDDEDSGSGLPRGVREMTKARGGYIDLAKAREYEKSDGGLRDAFDSSLELAATTAQGINRLSLTPTQFRELYGGTDTDWHRPAWWRTIRDMLSRLMSASDTES